MYTILTTIVVGTFIVIEDSVGKIIAARDVGIAIDIALALLIGFSFNALHRQVQGAIALAVRGQLVGALVCRRRHDGEAYAPDEVTLLANVAHEIGAELHAIRGREQAELLDKLLNGSIDVREARERIKG